MAEDMTAASEKMVQIIRIPGKWGLYTLFYDFFTKIIVRFFSIALIYREKKKEN